MKQTFGMNFCVLQAISLLCFRIRKQWWALYSIEFAQMRASILCQVQLVARSVNCVET